MSVMPFNPAARHRAVDIAGRPPLLLVVAPFGAAKNLPEMLAGARRRHACALCLAGGRVEGHLAMELPKSLRVGRRACALQGFGPAGDDRPPRRTRAMSFVNTSTTLQHVRDGVAPIAVAELKRIDAGRKFPRSRSRVCRVRGDPWLGLGARSGTSRELIYR